MVEFAFPYLRWVAASLVPLIIFQAYKQFADGLSKTRPAMYATGFFKYFERHYKLFSHFWVWWIP